MSQLINRRDALRTGLLASGGLTVFTQWQGGPSSRAVQRDARFSVESSSSQVTHFTTPFCV